MLKLAVVTLGLLLFAGAEAGLLGANQCTWGPSHWCRDMETAKKCSAVDYCNRKVWKTAGSSFIQLTQPQDDDACTFCKDMVGDVKAFITANDTTAKIEAYVRRGCQYFPDTYSQGKCTEIADHYLNDLMQMIKDGLDAQQICTKLSLCKSKDLSISQKPSKLVRMPLKKNKVDDSPMCDACTQLMAIAKKEIDDKQFQAQMKSQLEGMCQQLGDMAAECKSLVDEYLPQIFTMADAELGQLCSMLGFCQSGSVKVKIDLKKYLIEKIKESTIKSYLQKMRVGDSECDTCEEIFGYIHIFLSNNASEQEIQNFVDTQLCSQLGPLTSTCTDLVDQYFPQAFAMAVAALDPKTVCSELGLCNSSRTTSLSLKPAVSMKTERARASVQCVLCEFVIDKLDSVLVQNATKDEILAAVEKVCTILPATIKPECDSLVSQYGPAIVNLLVNDASPSIICGFLGLCSSGHSQFKLPLSTVKGDNCLMCTMAMNYLEASLAKNATQQEIMSEIERVCKFLPGTYAQECNSMVEQYGPAIVTKLINKVDGKEICTDLGLCSAQLSSAGNRFVPDGKVHLLTNV